MIDEALFDAEESLINHLRSDEEERRRWLAPATMQSAAMRRSGADD